MNMNTIQCTEYTVMIGNTLLKGLEVDIRVT